MSAIQVGSLREGRTLRLDIPTLVDTRALVTGNSGAGKSRLLRRLAEQAFGKVQVIVLDPEGEFATLREQYAFLLAGRQGEVQATPNAAPLLARRLMELHVSAVLDLYDLPLQQRREFARRFLDALIDLPKDLYAPVLVMVDESHLFCPEKSAGEAESTGAVIELMTRGRKRGICGMLATQRLSKLHKDAAAEAKNVFVGGITLDVDQKRAADALGLSGRDERISLRDVEPGDFFAYGPALSERGVVTVHVGDVVTTHPRAGQRHKMDVTATPDAIRRVANDLKDLPQQAAEEIRSMQALQARVRELEHKLRQQPKPETKQERVEVPILKDSDIARLEKAVARLDAERERMAQAQQAVVAEAGSLRSALASARRVPQPLMAVAPRPVAERPRPLPIDTDPARGLSGPEQRIINALAWLEMVGQKEPEQAAVAFLAGYTVGGGAFNNPRGALRTRGLIEYRGGDRMALTDDGRARAVYPDAPPTAADMQRSVLERLPGPEQKILRVLLEAYPNGVPNDDLAAAAGYQPGGGAYNNPRGRLRTLGLIEYRAGQVYARPVLFLEGVCA